jgi:hypothetical protein
MPHHLQDWLRNSVHQRTGNGPPPEVFSEYQQLTQDVEHYKEACVQMDRQVCQVLGKALGYPYYKEDQQNFPGTTEADGVNVYEHVAESIADEAAGKISQLQQQASRPTLSKESLQSILTALQPFKEIAEWINPTWENSDVFCFWDLTKMPLCGSYRLAGTAWSTLFAYLTSTDNTQQS